MSSVTTTVQCSACVDAHQRPDRDDRSPESVICSLGNARPCLALALAAF